MIKYVARKKETKKVHCERLSFTSKDVARGCTDRHPAQVI